jgi:hypothetical protein
MKGNQHSKADIHSPSETVFPPLFEFARKSAVALLRAEVVLLIVLVLYLFGAAVFRGVQAPGALIGVILFASLSSVGLFICSRGFAQHRSYGRAPALLANLILVGVSYFMISGHLIWVGIALGIFAGATALASLLGYTE